jgi:hypothetical protein
MPPDDNPLAGTAPAGTPEGSSPGTGSGNGTDPQGDTPLSLAAAAELITQSLAPMTSRLEELGAANAALAQRLESGPPAVGDPPPQATVDFLTQFSEDPEKAIDTRIGQGLQGIVPLAQSLINSTVSNFVTRETADIDREFGEGAWDKFFDKPLAVIMDSYRKTNTAALADNAVITREVDGLKGRMFNELVNYRDESQKKAAEAGSEKVKTLVDEVTGKVVQQTNLTGGIRRIEGSGEEITEGVKGYVAERIAAIGGNETPKDFLARTDYGNTLEDFLAHQEKMKAAEGGK